MTLTWFSPQVLYHLVINHNTYLTDADGRCMVEAYSILSSLWSRLNAAGVITADIVLEMVMGCICTIAAVECILFTRVILVLYYASTFPA